MNSQTNSRECKILLLFSLFVLATHRLVTAFATISPTRGTSRPSMPCNKSNKANNDATNTRTTHSTITISSSSSTTTNDPDPESESESLPTTTTTTVANQTFTLPTPNHLQTIQHRQLHHALTPDQVFCTSSHSCQYGHPQAFGFHPTKGPKLVSGLFRLSCPLLVKAIDEWEGEGGVREMSDWMRRDDGEKEVKIRGYEYANEMQKQIRTELVNADYSRNTAEEGGAKKQLVDRLGEYNAAKFLESGIAGIPPDQTFEVKCIHAHVADHLCRCSSTSSSASLPSKSDGDIVDDTIEGNVIGKRALEILQTKRGVPIHGNDVCWQQCNVHHDQQPGDWNYTPKKNRQGLRSTRMRRKEIK